MIEYVQNMADEGIDLNNFDKDAEIEKFKGYKVTGWKIAIRLYTAPQTKNGLLIPDIKHEEQAYEKFAGLVVGMGTGTYQDERYKHTGPWCKIGDWVDFPRHSGTRKFYKGIPFFIINEDAVEGVLDDPSDVTK